MRAWRALATATVMIALTAGVVCAQGDADVERAQKALKQAGHDPGPVDGVFGAQTRAALEAYQKAHGLEPSGRLDPATAAKLGAASTPAASPQTGGDTKPNAVDPAQSTKTGANAGEGASYSRSNEKCDSSK